MKNNKKIIISLFSMIIVFIGVSIFSVTATNNNILYNNGIWKSYFGNDNGWSTANGTLSSNGDDNFEIDITSTGNVQSEWTIQAEFDANASLTAGEYYNYTASILSDKTRKIYLKIQGESDSDIIAEKWIDLTAGEKYNLSLDILSNKNYSSFKIFYGLGWNTNDVIGANETNNIKVTNINLVHKELDYSQFNYSNVIQGSANADNYKFYSLFGLQNESSLLAHLYPEDNVSTSIFFSLATAPVTKVTVNGTNVDFYTNGGALAYITVDKFYKEYNEVNIGNDNAIISKVIIKNNYKSDVIEQVKSYLTAGDSDAIKELIENTIEEVNNAKTTNEVNQILNALPGDIEAIKLQETKDEAINKINQYLTEDSSDEVKELIEAAINNVNSLTTKDEIEARLNVFITNVTLQIEKDTAIKELTQYIGSEYSNEIKKIYETAIEKINNSTSNEEIIKIVSSTKNEIDAQIKKENDKKQENSILPDIPLTLDNIIIYILIAIVASIAIIYISKQLIKNNKHKKKN